MGKYSRSSIHKVLDSINIVDYISQIAKLKKKGKDHLGLCPFHSEKTPSFTVSDTKQFFYCFGCHTHGNLIDFVIKHQQLTFPEAVKFLSEKYQIPLEELDAYDEKKETQRKTISALNQKAQLFYIQQLKNSNSALAYLKQRGLSSSSLNEFGIGFAPDSWHALYEHCQPISKENQETCGLFAHKGARVYDRLRNRIVYPIHDLAGRCIGFGGRVIDPENQPKYLNSPDTPLFNKSNVLYGLYACLKSKQSQDLIVVEGYMDVIMLHQHGIKSAVASLGTAFTLGHLKLCQRYAELSITFCFDGDNAGQRAMHSIIDILLPHINDKQKFKFYILPHNQDPDSLIQRDGTESFQKHLKQAHTLDQVLEHRWQQGLDISDLQDQAKYLKKAQTDLKKCPDSFFKKLMLDRLAQQYPIHPTTTTKPPSPLEKQKNPMNGWIECLSCLLHQPQLIPEFHQKLEPIHNVMPENLQQCLKHLDSFAKHLTIPQLLEDTRQDTTIHQWINKALSYQEPAHPNTYVENYSLFLKKKVLEKKIGELLNKSQRTKAEQYQLSELIKLKHHLTNMK